ncbi:MULTISPECIES: hypothetical protein [Bradyrhizobium]|jgi:hypothetical protein|uniref:hypothetical protein n=1 Tax=Bradyrhizobium TaxID=374 RepID=UPI00039AC65B|nr:hypothetical protein [Bradyrhizobium denitrificans]MCL8483913.1 hypothetical protein [Bradyrhizobium denitrificans]
MLHGRIPSSVRRPWQSEHCPSPQLIGQRIQTEEDTMDGLIYLVGLIVVIMAILSFFGLR